MGSVTQNKRRKRETKTCEIKWDHEIEESKISVLMKHSQSICAAFKEKTLFWFRTFIFDFLFSHILKHAFFLCTAITWLVIFFLSFHRFDIVCVMRWSFICSANRNHRTFSWFNQAFLFSLSISLLYWFGIVHGETCNWYSNDLYQKKQHKKHFRYTAQFEGINLFIGNPFGCDFTVFPNVW